MILHLKHLVESCSKNQYKGQYGMWKMAVVVVASDKPVSVRHSLSCESEDVSGPGYEEPIVWTK